MAYLSAVTWGLGLPRSGIMTAVVVLLLTATWLGGASQSQSALFWALGGASRLSSGFLLGSTLTAMLLGHHYLTAPAMSIEPLRTKGSDTVSSVVRVYGSGGTLEYRLQTCCLIFGR
jgi:hypothetical protein